MQDSLSGIAYGNGHFVAVGRYPTILKFGSIITLAITPHPTTGFPTLWLEGPSGLVYTIQICLDNISWQIPNSQKVTTRPSELSSWGRVLRTR